MGENSKRIFSLLISMLLVMQLCNNPIITYADVNDENTQTSNNSENIGKTETEVKEVYFNKEQLKVGETLEIFVDIENLPEGSSAYAFLWFPQNPLYYKLEYNKELGLYTAKVKMEESFKYRTLSLVGIEIFNKDESSYQHETDLSVTVTDENGLIDKEAPVIISKKTNKNEIKVGEKLEILVEATDDLVGIKEVIADVSTTKESKEIKLSYDEANNVYKGYFEITDDLKYKTIRVSKITATDKLDKSSYSYDWITVKVLDENGNLDTTAPVINSVEFDKANYKVGDTVKLYLDAYDNESGINFIEAYVQVGRYTQRLFLEYNEEVKKYVDEFKIKEDMAGSKISLANLMIADNAYNYARFNQEISSYVLTNDGQLDKESPVVNSIEYSKDKLNLVDRLEIKVKATDNISGINKVVAKFTIGKDNFEFSGYNLDNDEYIITFYPEDYMYFKNLNIKYIEVTDNAGNVNQVEVNKLIPITNETGIVDEEAPTINSVKFSRSKVKPGEKLELYIDATDEGLGVRDVYVMLSIGEYLDEYYLRYDKILGVYKVSLDITEDMLGSEVKIYNLRVTDRGNNSYSSTPSMTSLVTNEEDVNTEEPATPNVPVINEDTDLKSVIEDIKASNEKEIEIVIKTKEKIVDKEIFKAIAGTDKNISFLQENGVIWTFKGKDIKNENLDSIKLSVSNVPTEDAKREINNLIDDAIFIKFDHHGILPGKASIKIKIDNKELLGKKLSFYYYNPETKKVEKISDNIVLDEDGYAIVEIDHCSDYFLSANSNLVSKETTEPDKGEVKTPSDTNLEEKQNDNKQTDNNKQTENNNNKELDNDDNKLENTNTKATNNLPETGGNNSVNILVIAFLLIGIGSILISKRKKENFN
ncbi:LPXTG cell wall anchor domain-containing protein [Clostridium sp.]|uniref:LPXTG cell wall anchor domain-containing protein n=1 Tax=Clostridium sp. TaxID=1506 RepID=UPI00290A4C79|nr:LPXTG cell wall anchor domain-containing protein [Clostridium sp.]MDU5108548.1 LPXTG cell wall anchor domain-containing protein [Clostridium sp.]